MKRWIAAVCAVLLLTLAGCGKATETPSKSSDEGNKVGIANPFIEYQTVVEMEQAAGFAFPVPDTLDGYGSRNLSVMDGWMAQAMYKSENNRVVFRKALGDKDINGDYRDYKFVSNPVINGRGVTTTGNAKETAAVAVWYDYVTEASYAVLSDNEVPLDTMTAWVKLCGSPVSPAVSEMMRKAYSDHLKTALDLVRTPDDLFVDQYVGEFGGCYVAYMGGDLLGWNEALRGITCGGHTVTLRDGQICWAFKDGGAATLEDAYKQGWLNDKDILAIDEKIGVHE